VPRYVSTSRPILAGLLLLAVPSVATAGGAGNEERSPGLVVEARAWWMAPKNVDIDYAFVDDSGSLSGGGEIRTLSYDRETLPRFYVGWALDRPGVPTIGVGFWQHETSASADTGDLPLQVGALLASPDFAIGRSLVDSASARSRIRATRLDFGLTFSLAPGERVSIQAVAGIRVFRYEEDSTFTYRTDRSGLMLEEILTATADANGTGPLGSARFAYRFGRVAIGLGLALAVPVGDLESESSDSAFVDGGFDRASVVDRPSARKAFVHLGGDLSVDVDLPRGWSINVAYAFEQWAATRATLRFIDDVSQNSAVAEEGDTVFEGVLLGVRHRF